MSNAPTKFETEKLDHDRAIDYILSGNATFTVVNTETGGALTFIVYRPEDGDDQAPHFVRYIPDPEDPASNTYLGTIFDRHNFRLTKASRLLADSQPTKSFRWLFYRLMKETLPETVEIFYSGRCGSCGSTLKGGRLPIGLCPTCERAAHHEDLPDRIDMTVLPDGKLAVMEYERIEGRDVQAGPGQTTNRDINRMVVSLRSLGYTVRMWAGIGARAWKGTPWPIRNRHQIKRARKRAEARARAGEFEGFFVTGCDFAYDF